MITFEIKNTLLTDQPHEYPIREIDTSFFMLLLL